jgi:hypothetical protein
MQVAAAKGVAITAMALNARRTASILQFRDLSLRSCIYCSSTNAPVGLMLDCPTPLIELRY